MEQWEINGHTLEYDDDTHTYIVDGLIKPSVTQILSTKFNDFDNVPQYIIERAGEKGTAMHEAIEHFETTGREDPNCKELRNYKFLKKYYKWDNIRNEVPIIYEENGEVLFAGRLDQIIMIDGKLGINDFKRVSAPNKEKICCQVNMYKLGYEQSYHEKIEFLAFTHLRENVRKFIKLPISEAQTLELIREYFENNKE